MANLIRTRALSLSLVVLVLLVTSVLQGSISYGTFFAVLVKFIPDMRNNPIITAWLVLRVLLMALTIILWILNKKRLLFKTIIVFNSLLTIGLLVNLSALGDILLGISAEAISTLLVGVLFMVITNILIFRSGIGLSTRREWSKTQTTTSPGIFYFRSAPNPSPTTKPGSPGIAIICTWPSPTALPSARRTPCRLPGGPRC
jgi:hypothetical protein